MKHYIHTLKTKLTIGSIRNQTRSNILRCCTARLQFIKGQHTPLVLGAAISNGCILIKGPESIHGPGIKLRCNSSKAGGMGMARDFNKAFLKSATLSPDAISLGLTSRVSPRVGSINVLHSLGGHCYSTKTLVKKVISMLSCCLKPAADVTADQQTGEISALQAITRQMEEEVDITSGLAEEITSQQITVYHAGEASTSQTARPTLSLFHRIMRQQITGPCEQQKESFLVAELAKRFIPAGPRFTLCSEYIEIIRLRDKCDKGLLPTEEEFKFLSLWPSVTWYDWLFQYLRKPKAGAEYEEIKFCLNEIRHLCQETLFPFVFLHPLLECLIEESSKRAFSFEPTFEKACEVLHTEEILSPSQRRHHALKLSDLLNDLAYWERRIMAAALRIPALMLKSQIGLESDLRRAPLSKVDVFLRTLMSERQETLQIPEETVRILSPFEPMTLQGIMFVIGGFLILAMALFLFFRWLWLKKPIRIPITPFKQEVLITKTKQGLIWLESKIRIWKATYCSTFSRCNSAGTSRLVSVDATIEKRGNPVPSTIGKMHGTPCKHRTLMMTLLGYGFLFIWVRAPPVIT